MPQLNLSRWGQRGAVLPGTPYILKNIIWTEHQKTIFLITDSQIKEEAFLEDIDSLLNTGEVANLYAVDEKQELIEAIRPVLAGKYGKDREFTPLGWF